MRMILIGALAAFGLGACTDGQRVGVGLLMGALSTAEAAQCAKPVAERQREWEATGRRVTPLDCTGPDGVPDGLPDFGPDAAEG